MTRPLKILMMASEMAPYAKTGGLGDVLGALPKALRRLGHDVRVGLPRYGPIQEPLYNLKTALAPLEVPVDSHALWVAIRSLLHDEEMPVYLVEHNVTFARENLYGYPDDGERFILFSRAIMEMLPRIGWQPDIIHCHDWQVGVVPNWMRTIYSNSEFFGATATVLTIHNLAYQGIFGWRALEMAGLAPYGYVTHPQTPHLGEVVDLLARGIMFADVVSTVSKTYAREITTPEYGERLDGLLSSRQDRLFGILNGIDYDVFDPVRDPHLVARFDAHSLDQRPINKAALQKEAGLEIDPAVPLMGVVSRLTDQKGFDILAEAFDHMMDLGTQFVLLGVGDPRYHELFMRLSQRFPRRAAIFLSFDAALAQRIYAGSDMFLMPSRFEPCGLGQLIAMRYGAVPIVRATGGLADTVRDWDPETREGTGFTFTTYDSWALFAAIVRAVETFRRKSDWRRLQENGMAQDFSWAASARQYVDLYEKALGFKGVREPGAG
ncbi:MAG: glycogen synthase GlgA [Chloroflexota bacterium]|nr:MAG: glycogen synthase GlgA [Chloroflexota bacterium]